MLINKEQWLSISTIEKIPRVTWDNGLLVFKVCSMVPQISLNDLIWLEGKQQNPAVINIYQPFRALAKETDGDFGKFV